MKTMNMALAGAAGLALYLIVGSSAASAAAKPADGGELPDDTPDTPAPKLPTKTVTPGFPLKRGSSGQIVRKLQAWLGVAADGAFGPKTETALQRRTGKTQVASQAELTRLLAAASASAQTATGSLTAKTATPLAVSLFQACYINTIIPVMGYDGRGKLVATGSTKVVVSLRKTPDVAAIRRVFASRSDADCKTLLGAFRGMHGQTAGGGFGAVLDNWTTTELKLWGLFDLRARITRLGGN